MLTQKMVKKHEVSKKVLVLLPVPEPPTPANKLICRLPVYLPVQVWVAEVTPTKKTEFALLVVDVFNLFFTTVAW